MEKFELAVRDINDAPNIINLFRGGADWGATVLLLSYRWSVKSNLGCPAQCRYVSLQEDELVLRIKQSSD